MRIGIDISQMAYQGTGVAEYTSRLVEALIKTDKHNEYVLFYSSLRQKFPISVSKFQNKFKIQNSKFKIQAFRIPLSILEFLWNRLHVLPLEWLIGEVDVFLSSDWIQPPTRAKKITIIHDLTPLLFPKETHPKIVAVQKRRLHWVEKECDVLICVSRKTKSDVLKLLKIPEKKVKVVYSGKGILC